MIKILFIEDDTETTDFLLSRLPNHLPPEKFEIRAVDSAEKALAILNDFKADIAIVDFTLPEMNGVELCRKIRNEMGYSMVKLVLSSAHQKHVLKGVEIFDHILQKPYTFKNIVDLINVISDAEQK